MTEQSMATVALTAKPFSGYWHLLAAYAVIAGYLFCLRIAAADLRELEQLLGTAVLDALALAHLPIKVACDLMRWDESNFGKAVRGESGHHLSLSRLARLPISFWSVFLPQLSYIVVKAHITQIVEDAKTLRQRV